MDFGIFGFTPDQAQEFRNFMATQHHHPHGVFGAAAAAAGARAEAGTGNGSATDGQQQQQSQGQSGQQQQQQSSGEFGGNGGGDQQGEPVMMHNASHNGVVCDVCNTEIRGFRYKCMQCADYDLCGKCEHKGHHAGHIMMRIAFPEQARSAIRRFMVNASPCATPPDSPPHHGHGHGHGHHVHRGHHHGGHHGGFPFGPRGPHGFGEHPFFGMGRRGGCHRRGSGRGETSGDEEQGNAAGERPATAPGCPYQMGKKEWKRWSKWMKKAAAHQHRSAEAYARAAAASGGASAAPGTGAAAGAENGPTECPMPPMDFAAVASQIQEFLNYWGIPVDVVELYDQFGNGGQPSTSRAGNAGANQAQQPTSATNNATAETTTSGGNNANAPAPAAAAGETQQQQNFDQQPASPASNLSENMEQMRIDGGQNNAGGEQRQHESLLMDLDAENSGWTIVGDQSREQSPATGANVAAATTQQPTAPQAPADTQNANQPQVSAPPSTPSSGSSSIPFASAGSNNSVNGNGQPQAPVTTPTAPPAFPAGLPNVPLYPVLNQPQIQQILQGVSSAVNSVVRSIPIVTDPRGPMGATTTPTPATPQQPRPATGQPEGPGSLELDARSMKTLNQLLAMGFSNEGGYLTRLVIAKKGDLEAVLSSLFPN